VQIGCKGISKTFNTRSGSIRALEDINLIARDKEFLCVLGPSGCGKTSLLRIIAGLLEPTKGEVIYEGERSAGKPLTSMVFQAHGVFPWMTVLDNVAFGLEMQGIPKAERYERAMEFIEKMDLVRFVKCYPHELSGGMRQRVGLARAFVSDPDVLLMDEPFASVDAQTRSILQQELLKIWQEHQKTVIYVTHSIEEAVLLADRVIVLTCRPGRVKKEVIVGLERPRALRIGAIGAEFTEIVAQIWHVIREEAIRSMEVTR
jgi:NitT/TauT family transport system ATP-binding protein